MLTAIAQIIGALMFSGMVAVGLGPRIYAVVALFVFAGCFVALLDAEHRARQAETLGEPSESRWVFAVVALTSMVFAAIWPSLPPIMGISSLLARRDRRGKRDVP
jgi:hypothetical protein